MRYDVGVLKPLIVMRVRLRMYNAGERDASVTEHERNEMMMIQRLGNVGGDDDTDRNWRLDPA